MANAFQPRSRDAEIKLLQSDLADFPNTRRYLEPLIEDALTLFSFDEFDYVRVRSELWNLIPLAAERFLANPVNISADYRFSTYFGWYISKTVDRYFHIRRTEA